MTTFAERLKTLTGWEKDALRAAYESSCGNGHDFGFTDDIKVPGLNKSQNGALVTNLMKKGILVRDDEFGQFEFGNNKDCDQKYDHAVKVLHFFTLAGTRIKMYDSERKLHFGTVVGFNLDGVPLASFEGNPPVDAVNYQLV